VRVLLDENVPVGLAHRLAREGWHVEHPILTGRRGQPDAEFMMRVERESDLVFLTQDEDFASLSRNVGGQVVISRLRQSRQLADRLDLWARALAALRDAARPERLLELREDGTLAAWNSRRD